MVYETDIDAKTYIHPKRCLGTRQVKGFKMKMKTNSRLENRLKKDKLKGRQRIATAMRRYKGR